MARIRHIALVVKDLEQTANFYQKAFGLSRSEISEGPTARRIYMSDGEINLAILNFKNDTLAGTERGKGWSGIHHIGFQVESLEETAERLAKTAVAKPRDDINVALGLGAGGSRGHGKVEVRYIGPDNVNFDVSETGWVGTPTNKAK